MNYRDIYRKRVGEEGDSYLERVQTRREEEFLRRVQNSPSKVSFKYQDKIIEGTLERNKQDNTTTYQWLLIPIGDEIDPGSLLKIKRLLKDRKDSKDEFWLVLFLEDAASKGYNRYLVVKAKKVIEWEAEDGTERTLGHFHGKGLAALRDTIKSAKGETLYLEDNNAYFLIAPFKESLEKNVYFEISEGSVKEGFRVTGRDIHSTPGIMYVSLDPTYLRDKSEKPTEEPDDNPEDFFWFKEED